MTEPLSAPVWHRLIFVFLAVGVVVTQAGPGLSLVAGLAMALTLGNPFGSRLRPLTQKLLAYSVAGLGAGMNLAEVAQVGLHGLGYTLVTIVGTLGVGYLLGRAFGVPATLTTLMSAGTAICGGSAIAALAPVVGARDEEISVSLAVVFLLNALALFIFPVVGHALHMDATEFGLWGALAIHDTSSVVGATMQYGPEALRIGTTVKLARALWIVPVTLVFALIGKNNVQAKTSARPKKPWFILGFVAVAACATYVPQVQPVVPWVLDAAHRALTLTLFFIGASLSRSALKSVGLKPLVFGLVLWVIASVSTLWAVHAHWITLQ